MAVEIQHERGFYQLTLLTKDRPALFASVAGAISSFGLNIVKAEAFSNATGMVVDTFTFADPHRTLDLNPPEVDRLRGVVRKVVEGKQEADKLLRGRPKPFLPRESAAQAARRVQERRFGGSHAGRDRGRGPARAAVRSGARHLRWPAATSRWC